MYKLIDEQIKRKEIILVVVIKKNQYRQQKEAAQLSSWKWYQYFIMLHSEITFRESETLELNSRAALIELT